MNFNNRDLQTLQALMSSKSPEDLMKALTVSSGFTGVNLEPVAKLLLPLFAGMRNRVAVDKPQTGSKNATWKMQLGYGSFDFAAAMGTAFSGVGSEVTPSAVEVNAAYATQAIKGDVEFEAIPMSRGYDDPLAIETSMSLATLIKLEELITVGGNRVAISAPVPAGNPSTLTTANTFAAGTWTVKVTAITLQGALANAAGNSNTGESVVGSVDIVVPAGDCDFLDVSWPAVAGAVGYKVYTESGVAVGDARLVKVSDLRYRKITAGATDLTAFGDAIVVPTGQTFVTVNHVQIVAVPANTQPAAPGADGTANANVFEGFMAWATKSTMYGQALGSHILKDMDGAPLTTAGSGVSEFDYILLNLWNTWTINPTLIVTSAQGTANLTDKLIAANNAAMYRIELNAERGGFTGGVYVGGYLNKFAAAMIGNQPATIPVWAHPYVPDGTFLFLTERVPYAYSRESRGFALDVMTPYTYFDLARVQRSFPFSTFWTETLKCYHPLAQSAIQGARVA